MANFCASCIDGTEGLQLEVIDGKKVLICVRCREADVREYNFEEGHSKPRTSYGESTVRYKGGN